MKAVEKLNYNQVVKQVNIVFKNDMHKKRQHSLSDAAFGLMNSKSVHLHHLGAGLAKGKGLFKKHATKQIDRLLSNKKLNIWDVAACWVPYIIGDRKEINVALDWTSFANDNHETICINLLTSHGRATPLLWKTVEKNRIKHNRARYEDQLLSRLKDVIFSQVKVTLIADRGFASFRFFAFLENNLCFNYIIRIQSSTTIMDSQNNSRKSKDWLNPKKAIKISNAKITRELFNVANFIAVKDPKMKQAWFDLVLVSRTSKFIYLKGKQYVKKHTLYVGI